MCGGAKSCDSMQKQPISLTNGLFTSVQFKVVSMYSEKPVCVSTRLAEASPVLSLKQFQCSSNWQRPSLVLSGKIVERFLFPRLSPPGDRNSDVRKFENTV